VSPVGTSTPMVTSACRQRSASRSYTLDRAAAEAAAGRTRKCETTSCAVYERRSSRLSNAHTTAQQVIKAVPIRCISWLCCPRGHPLHQPSFCCSVPPLLTHRTAP
jgi:hypothetical protein